MVPAYGASMPLNQVASISVPESRMLSVNIWDKQVVAAADKAIRESGLGLNPVMDGTNLRIPIPPLNEERRTELTRSQANTPNRLAWRCAMSVVTAWTSSRSMEKDGEISEDEQRDLSDEVQKLTDAISSGSTRR